MERIAMNNMEFIFCGMEWAKCSCATPDVEVGKICGVYVVLIMGI